MQTEPQTPDAQSAARERDTARMWQELIQATMAGNAIGNGSLEMVMDRMERE
ncbi:hypothetical protein [Oceaniglobus trochenteri]|uniref:hypothetical protein n=1 Tax=Oceaniglobus trochenteri TaxID=2763260 RepID=UPI001D0002F4|nr:hypothetical protein [Oceaniglobus trochenteri]